MKRVLTLIMIAAVIGLLVWQNPFEVEVVSPWKKWQLLCASLEAPNMSAADAAALIDKYDIDVNTIEGPAAPIQFAVYSGDVEKVRMLISRGASVQVGTSGPYSLPVIAIIDNNIPVLKELLAGGCDIECGNFSQGFTLLMCAVQENRPAMAEWLLQNGAQVNYRSVQVYPEEERNFTALHVAAWGKKRAMYDLLVRYGADESLRDEKGKTAKYYLEP
ncbi:MAG: ankyrin repeat domain-containing protein [Akkermansia sp.]|nr:ankyrin repeat domain-containing protein [Akkermansia sp.]